MRKFACGVALLGLVCLTACGNELPEMTMEQEEEIVEYAASIVMRYTRDYDNRLVDLSLYDVPPEEEEPEVPEETEPGGMDPVTDTPIVDNTQEDEEPQPSEVTFEELLQLPAGVEIAYNGYRLTDVYPDTGENSLGFSPLIAGEGNTLLVLSYTLTNTSGEQQLVDIFSLNLRFAVSINEGTQQAITPTFVLLDDFGTYVGRLESGESVTLVLPAEVGAADAADIFGLQLFVQNELSGTVVNLQ